LFDLKSTSDLPKKCIRLSLPAIFVVLYYLAHAKIALRTHFVRLSVLCSVSPAYQLIVLTSLSGHTIYLMSCLLGVALKTCLEFLLAQQRKPDQTKEHTAGRENEGRFTFRCVVYRRATKSTQMFWSKATAIASVTLEGYPEQKMRLWGGIKKMCFVF
jgi:uncharacterized protein (DUF1810 family)